VAVVLVALAAGAVVFAARTLGARGPRSPLDGATGAIAFVRDGAGGGSVISVVDLATRRSVEALPVQGAVEGLDWSPEGDALVFGVTGPNGGVFVAGSDGSQVHRLAGGTQPAWSPDGDRIAYRGSDGEIHVMAPDGSHDVAVTHLGEASYPDWSADAQTLAFVGPGPKGHRGAVDVYTANSDGSLVANLTSDPAIDSEPAWSPTGATIVFRTDRAMSGDAGPRRERLFFMNAEGGNLIRITDDTTVARAPSWSPDGGSIAFDDGRSVFVANADGSAITRVVGGMHPVWRPVAEHGDPSTTTADGSGAHDLAFDVCDVTEVTGRFDGTTEGTAFVASRLIGARCPAPLNAPQVIGVDVDGNGAADATFDGPVCQDWCTAWAAPDVDGDGTAELMVQTAQFDIAGVRLYDVTTDPPAIVPATVRPPGAPPFEADEPPQFWHGADGYDAESLACTGDGTERVLVATTTYQDPPELGPWAVHETTFRLHGAELTVARARDFEMERRSIHPAAESVCGAAIHASET
jgi:dipeptidyl aminopeptidase/acylaminoacyl peptidase